ncbi:MAG: hypothetical protein CVU38_13370 [Chloroflexi bacterium HGW-Chloroflexi-1]|nr:MAG: hypothetical protein CVU38_13370 [Chloroflexi bacterium HGW-Chloroflexi-1]
MLPILSWWLVIQLFGLAALPLAWRLFGRLPSRGYPLAKALGLLLVSFGLWLGASFGLLSNGLGGVLIAVAAVAGLSLWLGRDGLRRESEQGGEGEHRGVTPTVGWLRANWRLVLTTELLFLVVFVAWTLFRAYNPDIAGTEKPMEFAFINGVLNSRLFPPQDPWLSGYAISYYYFGYVMLGVLIRLTGMAPAVGFNLGVALWYALAMIGAFGIVYDLVGLGGNGSKRISGWTALPNAPAPQRPSAPVPLSGQSRGIRYGLLGALFVGFLGNLEGLAELAYNRGLAPLRWIQWLDIKQLTDAAPSGGWTGGFWWWWHASRVIHDKDLLGNSIEVIDEFPLFSFLLGDIHPHVLGLPFVLLAIGLAVNLLLGARDWVFGIGYWGSDAPGSKPERERRAAGIIPNTQYLIPDFWRKLGAATGLGVPGIVLYALALGALAFLNTWDFPIYVALVTLALGAGLAFREGITWGVVGRAASGGVIFTALGWLCYLPFYLGFQSQLGGILPNLLFPTRFSQYFLMFGPFLVVTVFFLTLVSRRVAEGQGSRGAEETGIPENHRVTGSLLRRVIAVLPWTVLTPGVLIGLLVAGMTALPTGRAYVQALLDNPAVAANIGGRTLGELVGLVLRVRAANPWTYLLLAVLIAWVVGMLWTLLSLPGGRVRGKDDNAGGVGAPLPSQGGGWGVGGRVSGKALVTVRCAASASPPHPVTDTFALLMIGLALLLTFSVEFVYLRDMFGTRMNTVFKFYYQAWVLLALAAAYGLSRLAERATPLALKLPALALTGLLVLGGLYYPLAAIPSKADNFRGQPTLDGLAYLRRYNPADMAAIEWIRANVPPDAVVLEATGGSYSPEGAGRVSMSTGNPTLLGWDFHERQWRGKAYDKLVAGRPEAIEKLYRTAQPAELPALLDQWHIDYVYVGGLERQKYGVGDAALARFDRALKLVYDVDGVRIYAR